MATVKINLENVLPLTREWIEIHSDSPERGSRTVLPLTREWIEIQRQVHTYLICRGFSLLRGSGLKYLCIFFPINGRSSPSYEGVDWNVLANPSNLAIKCSPSYEGVDWNDLDDDFGKIGCVLPLTREWIEIPYSLWSSLTRYSSPSYEGVDWNTVDFVNFS